MTANDSLSILSLNSSRTGLQNLSPKQRTGYYLQNIFENEKVRPDICFLPGDDERAGLNVIRGYKQFIGSQSDKTVFLYDMNKVHMEKHKVDFNSFGQLRGLDLNKLVVPNVEVSSLFPCKQVVKEFSMISWTYDLFHTTTVDVDTLVESIVIFSQRLAMKTEKPVLIGGEMVIESSRLKNIVKQLSKDMDEVVMVEIQPDMKQMGFLPSMTRSSQTELRHLYKMDVFECKPNNVVKKTLDARHRSDCFIASKQLKLTDASLLDFEEVTGRKIEMSQLKEFKPTKISMEIPVRPPRYHGG